MDVIELRRQEADAKMLRLICRWAAREGGDPAWLAFRLIERADRTIAWERKRSAAAIAGMRKLRSNHAAGRTFRGGACGGSTLRFRGHGSGALQ